MIEPVETERSIGVLRQESKHPKVQPVLQEKTAFGEEPDLKTGEEEKGPELLRADPMLYGITKATPFSKNRTTAKPSQETPDYEPLIIEKLK